MAAILTAAEMRALEQAAIGSGEVTGLELMERAGRGVVEAILAEWPEIESDARQALVLCGPGNNGGDGFVVARLLSERKWPVTVLAFGDPEKRPPDAKVNAGIWATLGPTENIPEFLDHNSALSLLYRLTERRVSQRLIVDALFGIGLTRPITALASLTRAVHEIRFGQHEHDPCRIVAIDVPSGVCADSGRELTDPDHRNSKAIYTPSDLRVSADLTVTFAAPKLGHFLADGPESCGSVRTVDIGLQPHVGRTRLWSRVVPWRVAKHTGHKYSHGHALLLSGGCGRGGAARLAARGALRIGAGLVTLAVPPAALQENAARLDAIMLRSIRKAEALADLLSDRRYDALAAGPGLGTTDREAALLHALLDASRPHDTVEGQGAAEGATRPAKGRAVVLDADALTLLARDDTLRAKLHAACVLTPHDGEFARLFPAVAERLNAPATTGPAYSKVDAARDAARESGATVLLKGPDTVIADPSGRAAINAAVYDRAAPWLATAGSGDVLSGMICGLLARGFEPFDAACTAAWLHVEAARSFGPGLIAEDLPEELPKVFRALGL